MAERKFKLTSQSRDGVVILHVVGSCDHIQYYQLEEAIQTQLDKKQLHLVVNLSDLTYISSAGVNVLGHAAAQYEKIRGKFCCVRPSNDAQWKFCKTIGIDQILPWAGSVEEAVKQTAPPAA